jgi:hypothetical protein
VQLGDVASLLIGLFLEGALQELHLLVKERPLLVELALQLELLSLQVLHSLLQVFFGLSEGVSSYAGHLPEVLQLGSQLPGLFLSRCLDGVELLLRKLLEGLELRLLK